MDEEVKTVELAKLYEKQAYYDDALRVYEALAGDDESNPEIQAAIERIRSLMPVACDNPAKEVSRTKIAALCEKWLRLVILKHRFHNFRNIKARLN